RRRHRAVPALAIANDAVGRERQRGEDRAHEAVVLSKDVKSDLNTAFVTSNFMVTQQDKLALSRGDIALGLIQIYKALGGGWQMRISKCESLPAAEPLPLPDKIVQPTDVRFLTPLA